MLCYFYISFVIIKFCKIELLLVLLLFIYIIFLLIVFLTFCDVLVCSAMFRILLTADQRVLVNFDFIPSRSMPKNKIILCW